MTDVQTETPPTDLAQLSSRLVDDVRDLDKELNEVDLLIEQAKTESARHVARRTAASDKLAVLQSNANADAKDVIELNAQLITLTKRAALMESQVDVLEGKRRALGRYRDSLDGYATVVGGLVGPVRDPDDPDAFEADLQLDPDAPLPPAVSRLVMTTQEDLRREISRAMHDGPAQSLTNIVLQAQIVEHLVTHDPETAQGEVQQLIAMVQQTLDATKTFIFEVRPMVLDDLGLLATLRRAARERGEKAGIPIAFDSMGQDRRLATDVETGLFRIVDEALTAYLGLAPERVSLTLEWSTHLEIRLVAAKAPPEAAKVVPAAPPPDTRKKGKGDAEELPPALAQMIEERIAHDREAAEAARLQSIAVLPPATWREIQDRATLIGVSAQLAEEGAMLVLLAEADPPPV